MKKQFVVGITGNIGAGKSTVSEVVREMGFPVFDSDQAGKELLLSDREIHRGIERIFGAEVFTDGIPDRKKIGEKVFVSEELLKKLNALMHPVIAENFRIWKENQMGEILFREAAVMIESGLHKDLDRLILVSCPEKTRLERVMKRDNSKQTDVLNRMRNQMSEDEKRRFADFEIVNDGQHLLLPQINNVIEIIKQNYENSGTRRNA